MYDPLRYYREDDSELSETIVKQYLTEGLSIIKLIKELEQVQASAKDELEKRLRISILQAMISIKLGLPTLGQISYFVDSTREILKLMQRDLTDNEKFKAHRHKSILGLYTEKAVY